MSALMQSRRSVLVLVDYQQRLMPAIDHGDQAIAHGSRLAQVATLLDIPVVGTEQNPAGLGPNVQEIRRHCRVTLPKTAFDGCGDGLTGLLTAADGHPASEVVIAGCEAHVCLMQSALGLMAAGLRVSVVEQACGSRSADNRSLAMQRLRQAGAQIVSVEMVAFEWLRNSEHPQFRQVLKLLK